jgi:hypothetical protein
MAFQSWDGYDHYSSSADFSQRSGFLQYFLPANPPGISFITGRNGFGKALSLAQGINPLYMVFGARNASAFVGFACQFAFTSGVQAGAQFQFMDSTIGIGGTAQVSVFFNEVNYSISIYRGTVSGGTLLYISANNVWAANVWNFVEMWPVINSSTGSIKVNVNGVTMVNQTGLNTQATANAWWDEMTANPNGQVGVATINIDDLYYADTSVGAGTYPANTLVGDSKVVTLYANGNDSVQWTPLAGANWQEISEIAMDSDVSYNYSSTPGQQDTFTFGALQNTITVIYGIQLTFAARKDDAGVRTVKSDVKISGVNYYGANHNIPDTTYAYFTDQWILDPATSANWTITNVNSAVYGYDLVA